jgi:cytochrome c551/c552
VITSLFALLLASLVLAACGRSAQPQAAPTEPPPTNTPVPPTDTPAPPTDTPVPPTDTPVPPTPTPELSEDEAMAVQLWEMLQEANYEDGWATVEGKGKLYRGLDPHGMLLTTYLNEDAAAAMKAQAGVMPDGAVIVKENYTPDAELAAITVMYKNAGYDENHNDWFWAKYGPDGTLQAAGKPAGCIACHGSRRTNDYIFTFPIAPIQVDATQPSDEDLAAAEQLWQTLQDLDYENNWELIPGKGKLYRGQGPHGMLLTTYLNAEAAEGMNSKPGFMPEGSIIVKENYTPDEELAALTVMVKQPGYDPEHNDWFWVKYGADGAIQAAGKPVGCIACHGSGLSNDYIFTFPVAPIPPEGPPPPVNAPVAQAETGGTESTGMETAPGEPEELPPAPALEDAVALITKGGCTACHLIPTVEGATGTLGPSWCIPAEYVQSGEKGLAFLRESILDPNASIEEGFAANLMPQNFGELFTDEEIDILVAFIANLDCSGSN